VKIRKTQLSQPTTHPATAVSIHRQYYIIIIMTSVSSLSSAPILLDLDASPISGQTGWAVLDFQGQVLKSNSFLDQDARLLFQMLQETAKQQEEWFRLTVTFPGAARFLVTRDDTHVYMVQTRVA
jgi:hypothetical protein